MLEFGCLTFLPTELEESQRSFPRFFCFLQVLQDSFVKDQYVYKNVGKDCLVPLIFVMAK